MHLATGLPLFPHPSPVPCLVRLPEGTVDKWFAKAGVDLWEDMPADAVAKCIEYVRNRLPSAHAA